MQRKRTPSPDRGPDCASSRLSRERDAAAAEDARFDRLAVALSGELDSLLALVFARLREKEGPAGDADRGAEPIGDLLAASLRDQLLAFRAGAAPLRCPDPDVDAVAVLARAGQLERLQDVYRLSQLTLWEAWFGLVEDAADLPVEERRRLLTRGSDFFFGYADLLSGHVADVYRRQIRALDTGGSERRCLRAVEGVLARDPLAASGLVFDLERHHLGLIAWGEDPAGVVRELARSLGRSFLAVDPQERDPCCWAWISGVRPLDPAERRALRAATPAAGRIALGLEAFGEGGFCTTHRQAARARRFAPPADPPLVLYEDFVVQSLACENEQEARAFVAHELCGIDDESATSKRVRETLEAYFEAEYNATATGARLGIHHQTVAQRLRTAEERMGHKSIRARRVELDVALRLRAILHAGALS